MTLKIPPREELIVDENDGLLWIAKGQQGLTYKYPLNHMYFRAAPTDTKKVVDDLVKIYTKLATLIKQGPVNPTLTLIFTELEAYKRKVDELKENTEYIVIDQKRSLMYLEKNGGLTSPIYPLNHEWFKNLTRYDSKTYFSLKRLTPLFGETDTLPYEESSVIYQALHNYLIRAKKERKESLQCHNIEALLS